MQKFRDRAQAGLLLAEKLLSYKEQANTIFLSLPRGGVPIGFEIAKKLHLPLDIYLVRKLGVPDHEELAMGAMASDDVIIFNDEILNALQITSEQINDVVEKEKIELRRRITLYRDNKPPLSLI